MIGATPTEFSGTINKLIDADDTEYGTVGEVQVSGEWQSEVNVKADKFESGKTYIYHVVVSDYANVQSSLKTTSVTSGGVELVDENGGHVYNTAGSSITDGNIIADFTYTMPEVKTLASVTLTYDAEKFPKPGELKSKTFIGLSTEECVIDDTYTPVWSYYDEAKGEYIKSNKDEVFGNTKYAIKLKIIPASGVEFPTDMSVDCDKAALEKEQYTLERVSESEAYVTIYPDKTPTLDVGLIFLTDENDYASMRYISSLKDNPVKGITYDEAANKLTLHDYNGGPIGLTGDSIYNNGLNNELSELEICIEGDNHIRQGGMTSSPLAFMYNMSVTFTGNGTLTLECVNASAIIPAEALIGVMANGIVIDGPSISINSCTGGGVQIMQGVVQKAVRPPRQL